MEISVITLVDSRDGGGVSISDEIRHVGTFRIQDFRWGDAGRYYFKAMIAEIVGFSGVTCLTWKDDQRRTSAYEHGKIGCPFPSSLEGG